MSIAYDQDRIDDEIDDGDCWECGGEGVIVSCFEEWACVDPDGGCELCTRPCPECSRRKHDELRAERIAVLRTLDVDVATAWLKKIGRWREGITRDEVLLNIHATRVACPEFTPEERSDSACWVEGLL